jgi:hypothetical protein
LRSALGIAAVKLFELILLPLQRIPRLLNLRIDLAALRRRRTEDGKETATFATHAPALRHHPIDFGLLAIGRVFGAPDRLGPPRVIIATVK